jgi:hypothetical protein
MSHCNSGVTRKIAATAGPGATLTTPQPSAFSNMAGSVVAHLGAVCRPGGDRRNLLRSLNVF